MRFTTIFALSLVQRVFAQEFELYDCTTDGLPVVVIIAGHGPQNPHTEIFLPLFSNCEDAANRKIAQIVPG